MIIKHEQQSHTHVDSTVNAQLRLAPHLVTPSVIRLGMNKKSHQPVDPLFPFYYQHHGKYHPCAQVSLIGVTRSHWGVNQDHTAHIMWLTLHGQVTPWSNHHSGINHIIILKHHIKHNNQPGAVVKPVCEIVQHGVTTWAMGFEIDGSCTFRYDPCNDPQVWIETDHPIRLVD